MAANLFSAYLKPPKSVDEYAADMDRRDLLQLQLQGQRGQNELLNVTRQGQMQAAQQQMAERNALQRLAQQYGGDEESFARELMRSGMPTLMSHGEGITKRSLDRKKTDAEIKEKEAKTKKEQGALLDDTIKRYRGALDFIDTPQGAARWMEAQYNDPALASHMTALGPLEQSLSRIPQDQQGFQQWRQQVGMGMEKWSEQQRKAADDAEKARHNKATEANTVRGQNMTAATALEGQKITKRGQDMTDDRQRDLNTITKTDKAAARKEESVNKAVTKFSDTLQKEGIPELEKAISEAEGAIGRYKDGEVPGVGRLTGAVPSALLSEEGNDVRQSVAAVRNIVLNARSGAAVTDQELRRLVEELGTGIGQSESALRRGLQKVRDRMDVIKANATAGVSDDVLNTYTERGGLKMTRGVPEKKKAEAKDANAFSDAEKEARYQAWKAKQK
jgi:hypothetical protein